MTFFDVCCGTGAISLRLLNSRARSLPMIGSKGAYAASVLDAIGVRGRRPDRLVMVDCGPWGCFWKAIAQERRGLDVATVVETSWSRWLQMGRASFVGVGPDSRPDGQSVYDHLSASPVSTDLVERSAAFACLQIANARGRAVQVQAGAWVTHGYAHLSKSGRAKGFSERLRLRQVADRIRALAGVDWPPTTVHASDLRLLELEPREGDFVVIDPPYDGTLGYGDLDLDRREVLYQARMLCSRGATVGICEGQQLDADLPTWHCHPVSGSNWQPRTMGNTTEWLTMSRAPRVAEQLSLLSGACR